MRRWGDELAAAFGLLTRLPATWLLSGGNPDFAACVWAYPVVGMAVGAVGSAVYGLASGLGLPAWLAAFWALAGLALATGGLHEDGLADTADGFGGASGRERKLEIMRDSCIGSYGAIALILSVGLRAAAIAAIATPGAVLTALIAAGALGRAALVIPLLILPPARPDGMAAAIGKVPLAAAAGGIGIALLAAAVLLSAKALFFAVGVAFAGAMAMTALAGRQIGGHTGDVLGATEIAVECLVLSALAA